MKLGRIVEWLKICETYSFITAMSELQVSLQKLSKEPKKLFNNRNMPFIPRKQTGWILNCEGVFVLTIEKCFILLLQGYKVLTVWLIYDTFTFQYFYFPVKTYFFLLEGTVFLFIRSEFLFCCCCSSNCINI